MAQSSRNEREGLSLQTLVIAAVASGIAAVLTSHFWKGGTVVAAAMTPVIVSIVKEALHRPMQSETVRTTARRVVAGSTTPRTREPAVGTLPPPSNGDVTPGDVLLTHPRRTYGGGTRRPMRHHWRLAVITGVLAFLVAAVVLTVPELLFGGAVSSGHRTTIFGGGQSSSQKKKSNDEKDTQPQQIPQPGSQQSTQPSATTPETTAPQATPTTPQAQPQQPSSGGAAPAPVPAPATPTP